jgi:competence protein ComEA
VRARLRAVLGPGDEPVPHPAAAMVDGGERRAADAGDFSDLSPLKWSDIVPSWPDESDLSPPAPASSAPAVASPHDLPLPSAGALSAAPAAAGVPSSGGMLAGPAAGGPPSAGALSARMAAAGLPEANTAPGVRSAAHADMPQAPRYPWDPPLPAGAGSLVTEPMAMEPRAVGPGPDPVPVSTASVPDDAVPPGPSGMPEWTFEDGAHDPGLSGAGAFGSGRRAGGSATRLLAFDPGRRGVKALAAVAVLVVLIAAVLAWRARPEVDPVAVPPLDAPAAGVAATAATDDAAGAGPPAARASGGSEVVVAVGGKVRKPGLVHLRPGARVADALRAAGGADPGTDVALLNLARKVVDGELIMVGVTPPPGAGAAPAAGAGPAGGAGAPGGPINLNTATLADLDKLPGVGPVLAQRILDARDAQGGFKAVSDLRKVNGIGDSRYDQLKDLVVV